MKPIKAIICTALVLAMTSVGAQGSNLALCLGKAENQQNPEPSLRLFGLASTSGLLFNHNLNAQIVHLRQKKHRTARIELAHQLWQKGLIHSEMDLIAQALAVVAKVIETAPSDTVYQLRAQINLSMHRFGQARLDLLRVSKPSNQTQSLLRQTALLVGNAERQVEYPSTVALAATQASVHISNKNLKQAEALLAQAVDAIADTSPIPMVALHLIGAQLADAQGDKALATAHINRAIKRLPNHVGALEAKAASHQNAGQFKQAIACLSVAKAHSSDPHLTGLLAAVYALNGDEIMAKRLDSQTIAQFRQALRKYPRAYAGEAAYYFARPGFSPSRLVEAQKWAQFDVNNRPLHQQQLLLANIRQKLNNKKRDTLKIKGISDD